MGICCGSELEDAKYHGSGLTPNLAVIDLINNMKNHGCIEIKTDGLNYEPPYLEFKTHSDYKYRVNINFKRINDLMWAWVN